MVLQTIVEEWNSLHAPNLCLDLETLEWSLDRWTKDQIFFFEQGRSKLIVKKDGTIFRIHLPVLFSQTDWFVIKKQLRELAKKEKVSKIVFGGGLEHLFCGIPIGEGFDFVKSDFESTQPVQLDFEGQIDELLKFSLNVDKNGSGGNSHELEYELADGAKRDLLLQGQRFLEKEFSGRWLDEFNRATESEKLSYFFLIDRTETICGFVRLYGWNPRARGPALNFVSDKKSVGGLGPVGVAKHLRGQGLGRTLLHLSWQKLKQNGIVRVRVDWTIEERFYKGVGLQVVHRFQPARFLGEDETISSIRETSLF